MTDEPTTTPIERRKVYELVAERLISRIGDGLRTGDALPPERELMQQYGVGRSSVREALRMLESRGLIESHGNGAFVVAGWGNPVSQSIGLLLQANEGDLTQLFEVRQMVECEAAALAAARRTDDHLVRLEAAIDDMAAGLGSERRYIDGDVRFHLAVAEATGNRVLLHLMHAIRDQLINAFGTVFHIPGSPERSIEQHRAIVHAIRALEPDRARALMREHIGRVAGEFESAAPQATAD